MVHNDWDSAIGTELSEPRLFLCVLHDVDGLKGILFAVCFLELFEQNARLPAVGRALEPVSNVVMPAAIVLPYKSEQLNALVGNQSLGFFGHVFGCVGKWS